MLKQIKGSLLKIQLSLSMGLIVSLQQASLRLVWSPLFCRQSPEQLPLSFLLFFCDWRSKQGCVDDLTLDFRFKKSKIDKLKRNWMVRCLKKLCKKFCEVVSERILRRKTSQKNNILDLNLYDDEESPGTSYFR